ncbi:hypothetical protein KY284_000726 [Solanum tuberosum]|nr:hypothetical protein KY284_000726 [Solanum tuberosum]
MRLPDPSTPNLKSTWCCSIFVKLGNTEVDHIEHGAVAEYFSKMRCASIIMETAKLLIVEGQTKVGGTIVCVSRAILMAVFRGPVVFGDSTVDFTAQIEISAKVQPEPTGWLLSPNNLLFVEV